MIVNTNKSYALLLLISCLTYSVHTQDLDTTNFDFDSFDFTFANSNDDNKGLTFDSFDTMLANISPEELAALKGCEPGEAAEWNSAFTLLNFPPVLNTEIYKKTTIPLSRNLINLPCVQICAFDSLSDRQFFAHLIYNQTTHKSFSASEDDEDQTRIGSYLNIECRGLLSALQSVFDSPLLPPDLKAALNSIDLPTLTGTIANARLEERRLCFMNYYYQTIGSQGYLEIKWPLLWVLRNLNFAPNDKANLEQQLAAFQGGDFDEDIFARKHLIMDALGSGTCEICVSKKIYDSGTRSVDVGFGLLLPTDKFITTGLYGTYFYPKDQQPLLNLCDIVNISSRTVAPNGKELISNYFLAALDQLSSNLLQTPMGYNQHLGCECKVSAFWEIRPNLHLNGTYTFEVFLPHDEPRFFIPKEHGTFSDEYNALPNGTDAQAELKLAFLEKRMTTLLFPRVTSAKIFPGVIFSSASSLHRSWKAWDFTFGYSSWIKTAEKILSIAKQPTIEPSNLQINKAINDTAWLIKFFGKIHKTIHSKRHDDISISLWADTTVFNVGVGNDFSLGVTIDTKF